MNIKRNASSRPWQDRSVKAVAPQHREATAAQAVAGGRLLLWAMLLGPALTILLLSAQASGSSAESGWHIEVVDAASFLVGDTALALDPTARPHIAYRSSAPSVVRYARKDGAIWQIETVDGVDGRDISLALDHDERPHIAYANDGLRHAWRTGGDWQIETIDGAPGSGRDTSLTIDPAGHPAIAFTGPQDNPRLIYAHITASGWQTETIDAAGGAYPSLQFDASGRPHVSYTRNDLFHAVNMGEGWEVTAVAVCPVFDSVSSSLAFDSAGRPNISYSDVISGAIPSPVILRHAYLAGTAWMTTTVDDNFAGNSSLVAGASERMMASYHFGAIPEEMGLRLATRFSATWGSEIVESGEGAFSLGLHSSLALDSNEAPHISYIGRHNNELRYAHREATTATRLSILQARSWRWTAHPGLWRTTAALAAMVTLAAVVWRRRRSNSRAGDAARHDSKNHARINT